MRRSIAHVILLGSALVGCGDAATGEGAVDAGPETDYFTVGAAAIPNEGTTFGQPDAGVDAAATPTRDAATVDATAKFEPGFGIVEGVRTNAPNLAYLTLSQQGLVITSIYFAQGASPDTLYVHGEFVNRGGTIRCILLMDAALDGYDVLVVADADPYQNDVVGVADCVEPGARGAFRGIEIGLPESILQDASTFEYAITGLVTDDVPHPDAPILLSHELVQTQVGYAFRGEFLSGPHAIWNAEIKFYGKDEHGLIVDDTSAFPLDLETIPPNSVIAYQTFAFSRYPGFIAGSVRMSDFLEGTANSSSTSVAVQGEPLTPMALRAKQVRDRKERLRALQGEL